MVNADKWKSKKKKKKKKKQEQIWLDLESPYAEYLPALYWEWAPKEPKLETWKSSRAVDSRLIETSWVYTSHANRNDGSASKLQISMKRESGTSLPWNRLSFIKKEFKQYPNAKIKREDPSINQLFLEPGNLRPK